MLLLLLLASLGGLGAAAALTPPCTPTHWMSIRECAAVRRRWVGGECGVAFPRGVNPVVFVGDPTEPWLGCPSVCHLVAKARGKPVARVCGSRPWYERDLGCVLWDSCPEVTCEKTCKKNPACQWHKGRNENNPMTSWCELRPGLRP